MRNIRCAFDIAWLIIITYGYISFLEYELQPAECPSGLEIPNELECITAAADFPYLYKMRSNGNAEFYKYRLGCFYYPG